ncbi:MAG: 1-(5-phosphoribosyl)-5-((5-phosphoribosylamino)methylideneamino)imidazole-4-carboxamide isomerase, partial [Clostridia bacterium]|nr:1-(5-phosphoribosyl)-5-((5-phosphoribosylamino)methylideneamino)imidazole-4-carboxamide isomerase [Clostridia bacterium]
MIIFPAIDLFGGKAVRLFKGDYDKMTIYSNYPVQVALDFKAQGAEWIHVVDLEGAKSGETPNIETIKKIIKETGLSVEVGGGIRSMEVIERYVDAG